MASRTRIVVVPSNQDYTIPGVFTADQIKGMYAQQITGLSTMVVTTTVENDVQIHTFNNPTGNKG